MTVDTRPSVTVSRQDFTTGWPEKKLNQSCMLKMVSGETLPTLKESVVEVNLGQSTIHICMLVTEIMDEFILGVDI